MCVRLFERAEVGLSVLDEIFERRTRSHVFNLGAPRVLGMAGSCLIVYNEFDRLETLKLNSLKNNLREISYKLNEYFSKRLSKLPFEKALRSYTGRRGRPPIAFEMLINCHLFYSQES